MDNKLNLGKLGFYWRMTDKHGLPPNLVPDFVDFSFTFLEEYQLIIQTREISTWNYLETIYKENYNVGYLQEGHDLAESYGNDFLKYIDFAVNSFCPKALRISEIGAGGCYILNKLKSKGFQVAAIDPSPIAIAKGNELEIEVIPDFYPVNQPIQKSDLIIHYDVLEHVADPSKFLRFHHKDLNSGGLILFAVPDCTSYINSGDISMVLHEHLNYFDSVSLQHVVESAGFKVLNISKADYGGVLYCIATKMDNENWKPQQGMLKFENFVTSYNKLNKAVENFIAEGLEPGNSLGCYIPLRAIPYLSIQNITKGIRFFDDNSGIHGQYFDGFDVRVENKQDLLNEPVSHLLIMSAVFGDKIKRTVNDQLQGSNIRIMSLKDFLAETE